MGQTRGNKSRIRTLYGILASRSGGRHRLAQTTGRQLRSGGGETCFPLGQKSRDVWPPTGFEVFARRDLHCFNVHLVLPLLILFSFYNYFLVANQTYLPVLFGFLFFPYHLASLPAFRGVSVRAT